MLVTSSVAVASSAVSVFVASSVVVSSVDVAVASTSVDVVVASASVDVAVASASVDVAVASASVEVEDDSELESVALYERVMEEPGLGVVGETERVGYAESGRAGLESGHDVMKGAARV